MSIVLKRIYEPASNEDGFRVLVDRLWPRGISKDAARVDLWLPDIGPSTVLRQWFDHDPERWETFCTRYHAELREKTNLLAILTAHAKRGRVTLLYSARDEQCNQAAALQMFLKKPRKHGSLIPAKRAASRPRTS